MTVAEARAAVIKAIKYAEDNGAVICNLSLTSTTDDKALYEAMKNSGMLFVVAAGNGNPKTGKGVDTDVIPFYPAAYDLDNIISVANLSFDGHCPQAPTMEKRLWILRRREVIF